MNRMTLEQEIFGKLLVTANQVQRFGDQVTKPLTLKQWLLMIVLMNLQSEAPTLNELSKIVGSSRQNVSVMARKLEEKGYLKLASSSADARAVHVALTPQGDSVLRQVETVGNHVLDELFHDIPLQDLQTTMNVVQLLMDRASSQ